MSVQQNIYRQRVQFSKIRSLVPIPNLIDIQKRSYDEFLQMNLLHSEREARGLKAVFESMFPVQNGKNPDGTYYAAKSLTCPRCGKRTKARLVKKADARTAAGGGELLK